MVFSTNDTGTIKYSYAEENITSQTQNSNPFLVPYTKITSKWVLSLNVKIKMKKALEENMKINICALKLGNFLKIWYQKSNP